MRITHLLTATAMAGALAVCADAQAGGLGEIGGGLSAGLSGGLSGDLGGGLAGGLTAGISGGVAPRLHRVGPELRQTLHGATAEVRATAVVPSVAVRSLPRRVLVNPVVAVGGLDVIRER